MEVYGNHQQFNSTTDFTAWDYLSGDNAAMPKDSHVDEERVEKNAVFIHLKRNKFTKQFILDPVCRERKSCTVSASSRLRSVKVESSLCVLMLFKVLLKKKK